MKSLTPKSPLQADTRFILKLMRIVAKKKANPTPSEVRTISNVFVKAGGSWEAVFQGSTADIGLLKRVIKIAVKKGFVTKREKWV